MKPLIACLPLLLVACSHNPSLNAGNPLITANCPVALPLLTDDTFGGTVSKLVEVTGIYHKCRAAAVGVK